MQLSYLLAFTTGILSFLAPCVLPLLPAYISVIAGVPLAEINEDSADKNTYQTKIIISSLLFVLGFTSVFTILGLGVSTIGRMFHVNRELFTQIGGAIIVYFGLISLEIIKLPSFMQSSRRIHTFHNVTSSHVVGPLITGMTFAFAWTPCVGAILGAIMTLAATSGSVVYGTTLLLVYSLGITIPFMLVSMFTSIASHYITVYQNVLPLLQKIGGILIVLTGLLILFGGIDVLSQSIIGFFGKAEWYQVLLDRL